MERIVRSAFLGELMKLALMGAGFALVFIYVRPLQVPTLFAGLLLAHVSGIVAFVKLQP